MNEAKKLIKNGASVNVNFSTSEIVVTTRYPVRGLPTTSGYRTNRGKKIIIDSLFAGSPGQAAKFLRSARPVKILTPNKKNGKSPSPRSANKKSASAGKRSRASIR